MQMNPIFVVAFISSHVLITVSEDNEFCDSGVFFLPANLYDVKLIRLYKKKKKKKMMVQSESAYWIIVGLEGEGPLSFHRQEREVYAAL